MCGIAGVAGDVGPQEREAVRLMCAAMHHRGPDDEGFFDGPGVSLGMRRLSIIDVAHGQQPTSDETGAIVSVFNGEIYNFRELQSRLRSRGHHLSSESDSECLPHLFEDSGAAMVDDLRGMFAIAVWDASKRQLFLARDRVGKKPLFYRIEGPRIWFASNSVPPCDPRLAPRARSSGRRLVSDRSVRSAPVVDCRGREEAASRSQVDVARRCSRPAEVLAVGLRASGNQEFCIDCCSWGAIARTATRSDADPHGFGKAPRGLLVWRTRFLSGRCRDGEELNLSCLNVLDWFQRRGLQRTPPRKKSL